MASRVAVIFTLVLSLLVLTKSQARLDFQKPENLPTQWNPTNDFSDSDAKSSIILPTDTIQSIYSEEIPDDRVVESEPKDLPEFNTIEDVRVMKPFTVSYDDGFRPINHHFHHMPPKHHHLFHFRFPIRCRHHRHHHQLGKPMGPRFNSEREIPYGNDMIISDQAKGPRFNSEREIPYGNDMIMSDQAKFDPMSHIHHDHMRRDPSMMFPRRPVRDNNGFREEYKMKRPHREEDDEHKAEKMEMVEKADREQEEGGFMFLKSFRKFLNDFKP